MRKSRIRFSKEDITMKKKLFGAALAVVLLCNTYNAPSAMAVTYDTGDILKQQAELVENDAFFYPICDAGTTYYRLGNLFLYFSTPEAHINISFDMTEEEFNEKLDDLEALLGPYSDKYSAAYFRDYGFYNMVLQPDESLLETSRLLYESMKDEYDILSFWYGPQSQFGHYLEYTNRAMYTYQTCPDAAEKLPVFLSENAPGWTANYDYYEAYLRAPEDATYEECIEMYLLIYEELGYQAQFNFNESMLDYSAGGNAINLANPDGDISVDGTVDTIDSIMVLQEYNKVSIIGEASDLTLLQSLSADVDMDGSITTTDALEILKRYTETIG